MMTKWLLPIFSLVCIVLTQSQPEDHSKMARTCFPTAFYKYSNPGVTGFARLDFDFDNSRLFTQKLALSCIEENLYVDITKVTLSLPLNHENSEFCPESQEPKAKDCRAKCPCCKVPASRCTKVLYDDNNVPEEFFKACTGNKKCNISVTSEYLDAKECEGIMYTCEKKCHSRWAEVEYSCRPKEQVEMMIQDGGHKLPWWAIPLIVGGCLLFLILCCCCCNKYRSGRMAVESSSEPNSYDVEDSNGKSDIEINPVYNAMVEQTSPKRKLSSNSGMDINKNQSEPPSFSRSLTLQSRTSGRKVKQMSVPPPPPPSLGSMSPESSNDSKEADMQDQHQSPSGMHKMSELQQRLSELDSKRASSGSEKPVIPTKPRMSGIM